jgi:hypothetical protein
MLPVVAREEFVESEERDALYAAVSRYAKGLEGTVAHLRLRIAEHKASFPEDKGDATKEDRRLWEVLDD